MMTDHNLSLRNSLRKLSGITLLFLMLAGCLTNKRMEFYVSPDGDDSRSGTKEAPFRTVEKAQQAVRALTQKKEIPRGGIIVYLRGGVYPIRQTIRFTLDDSGKEGVPIVYRSYPGEEVHFTGGQEIHFGPLNNPEAKLRIRAPHDSILQADLKVQGITDFGERKASGFGRATVPAALELFFNDEPMVLARYPNNNGWMQIASVPQTGDSVFGGDERTGRGVHYGRFVYAEDRISRWQKNNDIWLHGYWTWDWADSYVKVGHIDAARKEFILTSPHGVYGYSAGQRYYALNVLEELDSPGEWYLDKTRGLLYFWPPSQSGPGKAVVSVMEDLMVHFDHTEHLHLEGIIFEYARGSVAKMEEGCDNTIGGCTIRNIGNNAVDIIGGHHNGVSGCELYNIGDAGITITGGDRLTLTSGHNFAINNHIRRYSRINQTYRPAVSISGVGNLMAHNDIHSAPHMAVAFGGNDHVLEYNEVHDIAQETGDVGAFYIGRDWTMRGNIIRYNYFHHLAGPGLLGVNAVYLDDFACGTTIYGNIFYKAGNAAFVGGGHDNVVENNVFADCESSIHLDARGVNWAKYYMDSISYPEMFDKLKAVHYTRPPYSERYPELLTILETDFAQPKRNVFRANLSYGSKKWRDIEQDVDEMTIEDNYVTRNIPEEIDIEKGKLYPSDEKILNLIGFHKIPFDSIGLYPDQYRNQIESK
ncbi:MAG: right-handed parallel beta-helix repeat-containing protein [Prolixibacteraceae bacterium]